MALPADVKSPEAQDKWMREETERAEKRAPIKPQPNWPGTTGTGERLTRTLRDQRRSWISQYAHDVRPKVPDQPREIQELTIKAFRELVDEGADKAMPTNVGFATLLGRKASEIKERPTPESKQPTSLGSAQVVVRSYTRSFPSS